MLYSDEDRILRISVRINEAPLDIHEIDLHRSSNGSGLWTLTIGSIQYLDRRDVALQFRRGAGSLPSRESQLTVEQVEPVFRRLRGLLLPASPPFTGGLDGHTFSVRFDRAHSWVEYHWWGWVPDAWAPLGDIVDDVLSLAGEPDWPRARRASDPASSS